ncbi:MAG TPA: 5-formyltetrahydrofolate cyclo-ligase [Verrucomicrobiae bacterium]
MSEGFPAVKETMRRRLRGENSSHSAEEKVFASSQICSIIRAQPLWQNAKSLLLYHPLPGEPDILPLLNEALSAGKSVCLPRSSDGPDPYVLCRIEHSGTQLAPGKFGILEPKDDCPSYTGKSLDLLLVPGLGFSLTGQRLGRGKGFYDRLLRGVQGAKCGVAFDWQILAGIPAETHDMFVEYIVTPAGWREVSSSPRV